MGKDIDVVNNNHVRLALQPAISQANFTKSA